MHINLAKSTASRDLFCCRRGQGQSVANGVPNALAWATKRLYDNDWGNCHGKGFPSPKTPLLILKGRNLGKFRARFKKKSVETFQAG